jgi:hypothetical protein
MNIIFDESPTKSLYGVSYDTIFTVSVTITIFVVGYFLNRLYDNTKRKNELKDTKAFLIAYLRSLLDPIEKQIVAFRTLSADVRSKKHQDFSYGDAVGVKLDVLDSLPQVDVFKAFLLGPKRTRPQRIAHFNRMLDALEYTKRQRDTAMMQFKDFVARHTKYLQQWNASMDGVMRSQEQFVSSARRTNTPPSKVPFVKGFNLLVHQWSQLPDYETMDQAAQHLLEPLRQLCKRESIDPRVHYVIPFVMDCLGAFRNRNHLLSTFAQYFEDQAAGLQAKKDALTECIKCIEES